MDQQKLNEIWENLAKNEIPDADIKPRIISNDHVEQAMSVPGTDGIETGPWVRRTPEHEWEKMKYVGHPDFK